MEKLQKILKAIVNFLSVMIDIAEKILKIINIFKRKDD